MIYFKLASEGMYVNATDDDILKTSQFLVYELYKNSPAIFTFDEGMTTYIKNRHVTNYQYTDEERTVIILSSISLDNYLRHTI